MDVIFVLTGAVLLYAGGETLVKGAVSFSRIYGVSSFVVGLTVVAFGTSTPELASTLLAVRRGSGDLALGNVIGSNTANIGLILGAAAAIQPIAAHRRFLRRESPLLLAVAALLAVVVADASLNRGEGLFLALLLLAYVAFLFRFDDMDIIAEEDYDQAPGTPLAALVLVIGGALLLVLGAGALVEGSVSLARRIGVSERVIGITLVAFGTSLPELATAVVAALQRQADIALGNVVGSNIFNILGVLGVTAAVHPFAITPPPPWLDMAVMLGFSVALVPFVLTRRRIDRAEGALLLIGYFCYVAALFAAN